MRKDCFLIYICIHMYLKFNLRFYKASNSDNLLAWRLSFICFQHIASPSSVSWILVPRFHYFSQIHSSLQFFLFWKLSMSHPFNHLLASPWTTLASCPCFPVSYKLSLGQHHCLSSRLTELLNTVREGLSTHDYLEPMIKPIGSL